MLEIRRADYKEIAHEAAHQPLARKVTAILEMMRDASRGRFGRDIDVNFSTYPTYWCHDESEMRRLFEILEEQGLLRLVAARSSRYELSPAGWDVTEPTRGGPVPGRVFVAMAADPRLDSAYERGIAPAIADAGLASVYINKSKANGSINAEIEYELRRAEMVVADCTISRGGVYFEAGFGLALGRQVIFTCSRKAFGRNGKGVHFDTRHHRHVVWADEDDLRKQLADRLRATTPSLLRRKP